MQNIIVTICRADSCVKKESSHFDIIHFENQYLADQCRNILFLKIVVSNIMCSSNDVIVTRKMVLIKK